MGPMLLLLPTPPMLLPLPEPPTLLLLSKPPSLLLFPEPLMQIPKARTSVSPHIIPPIADVAVTVTG